MLIENVCTKERERERERERGREGCVCETERDKQKGQTDKTKTQNKQHKFRLVFYVAVSRVKRNAQPVPIATQRWWRLVVCMRGVISPPQATLATLLSGTRPAPSSTLTVAKVFGRGRPTGDSEGFGTGISNMSILPRANWRGQ